MNLMNNPYVRRSSQLVEAHSAIGKRYVPKNTAELNRWIAFTDKVMSRLDELGKKAVKWEQEN